MSRLPLPVARLGVRLYAALDAQDWPLIETLVSPSLSIQVGSSPPMRLEEWRRAQVGFYTGFPDGRHVVDEFLVDGERFVTRCRFTGTHTGPFAGVAATGIQVSAGVIHIDRFVDGLLVEHHGQLDMFGLLRQIGAASAPA
ncbi:ester cyclase [Flindersiella endophytica]